MSEQHNVGVWRQDPTTQRHANELQERKRVAYSALMHACKTSTDPDVRGLHAIFQTVEAVCNNMFESVHVKPARKAPPGETREQEEKIPPKQREPHGRREAARRKHHSTSGEVQGE